jgi:hypothetical protein
LQSLLLIGKSQAERHEPSDAIQTMKKALNAIATYKIEGDPMLKQLQAQEKEIRKVYAECLHKMKAIRMIEKQRAKAMFGGGCDEEDMKHATKRKVDEANTPRASTPDITLSSSSGSITSPRSVTDVDSEEKESTTAVVVSQKIPLQPSKKRVSFADGTLPGDNVDDAELSFFQEHMEALLLAAGFGLGCWLVSMAWKKR